MDAQPFQSQHEMKEKKLYLQMYAQIVLVTGGIGITIPVSDNG